MIAVLVLFLAAFQVTPELRQHVTGGSQLAYGFVEPRESGRAGRRQECRDLEE